MKKQKLNEMKSQKLKDLFSNHDTNTTSNVIIIDDDDNEEENKMKDKNAMILVRWNEDEKTFAEKELMVIFQDYGRVLDLEVLTQNHCAFILFDSVKSAEKACVVRDLGSDFGLTVSFAGEKTHRQRIKEVQRWTKIRPNSLTFQQYHDFTQNRVFELLTNRD